MDTSNHIETNPELDASIDQKVTAAIEGGADLTDLEGMGLTKEEVRYLGIQQVHQEVRIAIGRKIVETLHANNVRINPPDIIPALTAYFEAVEAGEIEAA
ncbi:hypothetical protein LUX29_21445 [Aureimonas altamirensis]|uniref:hypothetical protein n=1 Tax=Aureimonas altamirensis TaxID=370622 RepID=UPI001E424239|nr:hypothetical protein [Aureimonas altamirensis]UHD45520.1 hypothetical protein LUX29_21445 [Aureimonas altamirensis]